MSEKLCLQWNDFKENFQNAFGSLREGKEYADVTLACEDGQQVEAHKLILAASSPVFEIILQRNKHSHPWIYFRGFQNQDLQAILDFVYYGEANISQENLDSFFAIAEELKIKGLIGQTSSGVMEEVEETTKPKCEPSMKSTGYDVSSTLVPDVNPVENNFRALAIHSQFSGDLEALDDKVKSLMQRGEKMIANGMQADGRPKLATTFFCKVCGKEGVVSHIRDHIEFNHLEGISIPCEYCEQVFGTRNYLRRHRSKFHK